jgi:hypothetical protein
MAEIQQIIQATKALENLNAQIVLAGKNLESLLVSANKVNTSITTISKSTENNTTKQTKLNKEQKEAEKIARERQKAIDSLEKQRQKGLQQLAKQEAKERELKKAIDQQVNSIRQARDQNIALRKERDKLNLSTDAGRKKLEQINKQIDKNSAFVEKNSDKLTKQKIGIGRYENALKGLPGILGRATNGVAAFGKQLMVLLANPIIAIVAGIVAGFTALVAAFKRSQQGIDFFRTAAAKASAVLNVLLDRITGFAKGLFQILKGNFSAGIDAIKDSFKGMGDEIEREVKAAGELEKQLIALEKAQNDSIITTAKNRREIAKLRLISNDQTKANKERIIALQEANRLEQANSKIQEDLQLRLIANKLGLTDIEQARKRINDVIENGNQLTLEEIGLSESTEEDRKVANEAIAQLINIRTQEFTRRQRIASRLTGLQEEERKAEEKRLQEEQERAEIREQTINDIANITISQNELILESERELAEQLKEIDEEETQSVIDNIEREKQAKEEAAQRDMELEEQKRNAKLQTLSIIRGIFGQESAIGKAATALQATEAIRQNLISLGIITTKQAEAEAKAAAAAPFPFNLPLIAGTIAQFVSIIGLFKKGKDTIPAFATGTENSPSTFIAGEAGRELMKTKDGRFMMANQPTLFSGMPGTVVIPNKETEAIMNGRQSININLGKVENELSGLRKDLRKQKQYIPTNKGVKVRSGNYWKRYNDIHYN